MSIPDSQSIPPPPPYICLFSHLFILMWTHGFLSLWVIIQRFVIHFIAQIVPALETECSSQLAPVPLLYVPAVCFLSTTLVSGITGYCSWSWIVSAPAMSPRAVILETKMGAGCTSCCCHWFQAQRRYFFLVSFYNLPKRIYIFLKYKVTPFTSLYLVFNSCSLP